MTGPAPENPTPPPALSLLLVLPLAILFALLFSNVIVSGFEKLGMPRLAVMAMIASSLVGSLVNVPLWHRDLGFSRGLVYRRGPLVYYQPPRVEHQVIAVNVGGALVPIAVSIWLLGQAPLWQSLLATGFVTVVVHSLATIVPGKGIAMPGFVAPIVAAGIALLLAGDHAGEPAAIAYVSGSFGTLIGADLLNLHRLRDVGPGVVSLGGAGVFDGIFLVGLVAAVLA